MESKKNNYFIGLDAGTGSVGWAVTDEEYKLLKFNGKDLWGMRCFETAQTAEGRRLQRASRRRLQRRNRRLMLLQELFAEEVTKTDPAFFQRLKESSFYKDDKNITQKNSLFNDASFTDKEYHQLYPTIHHLIKAWIDDTAKPDIRLLYLACHNIIKKRGHFYLREMILTVRILLNRQSPICLNTFEKIWKLKLPVMQLQLSPF